MKTTLQYISAKTLRYLEDGKVAMQGTGTIIQSRGHYYLLTAYHCLCKKDSDGNEVVPADWHKMKAIVYTRSSELELNIIGLEDADQVQDWVILKIDKPNDSLSANTKVWLTNSFDIESHDVYASYGFPRDLEDGMYLEFSPTNTRGKYWRIHDTVEGGDVKSITIEKGTSGMGLFRKKENKLLYLGLINKSAPNGAMNAMLRVPANYLEKYFDDILEIDLHQELKQEKINVIQEEIEVIGDDKEKELRTAYNQKMLQADFVEAAKIIEQLHTLHPEDEIILLNYIHAISMSGNKQLEDVQSMALAFSYTSPDAVSFVANIFTTKGYPQTALDIFYQNALRMNDPILDSLYYATVATTPILQSVARKEYDDVEEGKCVLYTDEQDRRHCWLVTRKNMMGEELIGHHKDENVVVQIAGEERKIRIIAIFDKYFAIEHRALMDVMEHGGNRILTPFKLNTEATSEEQTKQLLDFIQSLRPGKSIEEQMKDAYAGKPCLGKTAVSGNDLVPSYYYMLFSSFILKDRPEWLGQPHRFSFIKKDSEFVLDLSSFLVLSERYFSTGIGYRYKFIVSRFLKAVIENFCNTILQIPSFLMHQVLSAGKLHRFSNNDKENMEHRILGLRRFLSEYCVAESVDLPAETLANEHNDNSLLFLNTMMLLNNNPNRVLVTEDWYINYMLKGCLLEVNVGEYISIFS